MLWLWVLIKKKDKKSHLYTRVLTLKLTYSDEDITFNVSKTNVYIIKRSYIVNFSL